MCFERQTNRLHAWTCILYPLCPRLHVHVITNSLNLTCLVTQCHSKWHCCVGCVLVLISIQWRQRLVNFGGMNSSLPLPYPPPFPSHFPSPSRPPFPFPPLRSRLPLIQLGSLGERCKLAQQGLNLVHFSLKIWHLVATILMIFLRINWTNSMQFEY